MGDVLVVVVVSSCLAVGKGIGDLCDVIQSPRWATSHVENTANCCEKVTSSDHFEPNVQRKAGSMIPCMWDESDKFGIGPNAFFSFSPRKKSWVLRSKTIFTFILTKT